MSDSAIGNCLHLYLQNYALIWSLEEQESLPPGLKEEEELISSFVGRASDQASNLLESLYVRVVASALPYRIQRRSQRKTVRDQWRMDGPLLRPREKVARSFWSLFLGCLRDRGPTACLIVSPNEPDNPAAIEALGRQAASSLGIESGDARTAFTHDTGYESGVVVGTAPLTPEATTESVAVALRESAEGFFARHKATFEQAINGG